MVGLIAAVREIAVLRRRRKLRHPEYRALAQIVAEAELEGRRVVVLGPCGILEVTGGTESIEGTDDATGAV